MGCLPHALLVTIEDAADGGLGYNSSPALRSASRAAARGLAGTPAALLPRAPPLLQPEHHLQRRAAGGRPRSPASPRQPPAARAGAAETSREAAGGCEGGVRGASWGLGLLDTAAGRCLLHRRVASDL